MNLHIEPEEKGCMVSLSGTDREGYQYAIGVLCYIVPSVERLRCGSSYLLTKAGARLLPYWYSHLSGCMNEGETLRVFGPNTMTVVPPCEAGVLPKAGAVFGWAGDDEEFPF